MKPNNSEVFYRNIGYQEQKTTKLSRPVIDFSFHLKRRKVMDDTKILFKRK